jgi:hypothetical protein
VTSDPASRCRLTSLGARGANRLYNLDPADPSSTMHNSEFVFCFRYNLGLPPSKVIASCPLATCCCGFLLKDDPTHLEACITFRNTLVTKRHHSITSALASMASEMGVANYREHLLQNGTRTDLTLRLNTDPRPLHIDTSVVQPSCATYRASKAQSQSLFAACDREEVKTKKYADAVSVEGGVFSPFVFESYGAPAPAVIKTIEKIRASGELSGAPVPSTKSCLDRIFLALARGNALIHFGGYARTTLNNGLPAR